MIVDDNEESRYLFQVLLTENGYDVVIASNGAEALEVARKRPPDLLISDLLMPVMDGFSLCREWRADQTLTSIPFLVYTASYTDPNDEDLALSLGADGYILKPQDPEVLLGIVREQLSESADTRQPARQADQESAQLEKYSATVFHKLEKKMAEVAQKNAALEQSLEEQRHAEIRIEYLNRVLRAIREVSQAITRERDRETLIQRACEILVDTDGFEGAWIILTDRFPDHIEGGHAGFSDAAFAEFLASVQDHGSPRCCADLHGRSTLFTAVERRSLCAECPLPGPSENASVICAEMTHEENRYGFLGVYPREDHEIDAEEVALLGEVADDLAYAFRGIETDAARIESEESFRTIFEKARDGILVVDADTQRFVNANPAACRMLACDCDELKELTVDDLPLAVGLEDVSGGHGHLLGAHGNEPIVIRLRRRDGVILYAELGSVPIDLLGRRCLLAMIRDVTRRVQAEQDLRDANQRLTIAQGNLALQTRWVQHLNNAARDIARGDDLEGVLQVVIRYLESDFDFGAAGVCLVNEAGRLEIAALSNRGRLALENLGFPVGSQLGSPSDLAVTDRMSAAPKIIYLASIEAVDDQLPEATLIESLRRTDFRTIVQVPLATESARVGFVFLLSRGPLVLSEPERGFLEGLGEYVSLAIHNRHLYDQLDDSYKQLQATQRSMMAQARLNAMGQMASGVAHDINNTLAPITLYVEALVATEFGQQEPVSRYLSTIQSAVGDIEGITSRLRAFYRAEEDSERMQVIDVAELFSSVVDLTRPRWKDMANRTGTDISVVCEVAPGIAPLSGILAEIREALINLVLNATDAMPGGGRITLRASMKEPWLVVEVIDTGCGMSDDQMSHCLEPFFTTKGTEGSGLGLPTVYGTMQRHRGELQIDSKEGEGTSVRMMFPVSEEPPDSATAAQPETTEPLPPLRILCVDDNATAREALAEMLTGNGHDVVSCSDGEEAIAHFEEDRNTGARFDVVITDFGMPHMDGRTLASRIKELSPGTPVILLSGWGNFMSPDRGLPEDVDWVLGKPPTLARVLKVIRAVIVSTNTPRPEEQSQ